MHTLDFDRSWHCVCLCNVHITSYACWMFLLTALFGAMFIRQSFRSDFLLVLMYLRRVKGVYFAIYIAHIDKKAGREFALWLGH